MAEEFGKNIDGALDWDAVIEKENEFVLLMPGEYDFTVVDMERQRFEGSEKMAPCNVAKLSLRVESENGTATLYDRLFLHKKSEWKLSQFFGAIGQKKHGDALKMNWDAVKGSKGRAKIKIKTYNDRQYNEVERYIYAEDVTPESKAQQPTQTWKAGGF